MNDNILVSLIVAVYNGEKYIASCIDSIMNQTYKNYEVILVDDGSKDSSGTICDHYAEKDSRIKVIHQVNRGCSAARNEGLSHAKGEYIIFVDSDDFLNIDTGKKLKESLEKNNSDIVLCGFCHWSTIRQILVLPPRELCGTFSREEFAENFSVLYGKLLLNSPCNKIYKKEIIDQYQIKFDERRNTWEDRIFVVEFLRYCDNYYCMDECFYNYVSVQESLSRRYNAQYLELILKNYNLYVQLFGEEYDFSSQYVIDYWSNSIENVIIQQLKVKNQHKEVIENITNILKEPQVKYWFKNRNKKDENINEYFKKNQYDRIIEIYEKRLLDIQKNEKKVVRKQRLKAFVRRLIKE